LVVVSAITILLVVGVPKFQDFTVRARVSEGLVMASAAMQAMRETCISNPSAKIHDPDGAGFHFEPSKHVAEIIMSADCSKRRLWVGLVTRDTGAFDDPYLSYVVLPTQGGLNYKWDCRLVRGLPEHVPADCRPPNT
jgi:type IV pilus assembly protein PilA